MIGAILCVICDNVVWYAELATVETVCLFSIIYYFEPQYNVLSYSLVFIFPSMNADQICRPPDVYPKYGLLVGGWAPGTLDDKQSITVSNHTELFYLSTHYDDKTATWTRGTAE